jgi:hypothetical protein
MWINQVQQLMGIADAVLPKPIGVVKIQGRLKK